MNVLLPLMLIRYVRTRYYNFPFCYQSEWVSLAFQCSNIRGRKLGAMLLYNDRFYGRYCQERRRNVSSI